MEDQRATLTNIVILVVGAGLAFVTNEGLGLVTLAVSIPMVGIGPYGAVTTAKYFGEMFQALEEGRRVSGSSGLRISRH
jgi:hypothetical protein